MDDAKKNKIAAITLLITSPIVFGVTMLHATADTTNSVPATVASTSSSGVPVRLTIPALSIDANVQQVGVTEQGDLAVPSNFTDVAWYAYGPQPGQVGSAVIDGHVDNGLTLPGVFKNLSQIKEGDSVYVKTATGSTLHFVVQQVAAYPYQSVPKELLFGRTDVARLNLITCTGNWLQAGRTYDTRLVVYTVLAP